MRPRFVLVLASLLWLLLAWAPPASAQAPQAREGRLDLSGWHFGRDGPVGLDGDWQFVPHRLVGPGEDWPADSSPLAVPGDWNAPMGRGHGVGSYRLRVDCAAGEPLALGVPFEQTAAAVFVNGRQVAAQGRPGAAGTHRPAFGDQLAMLQELRCPLEIRVQASNFEFYRGGLMRSIRLGPAQALAQQREHALLRGLLALGAVLAVGLFGLLFYAVRPRETVSLWFGVFCFSLALSLGLSGDRVLQPVISPLGFELQARLLMVNWYLSLLVYPLLLRGLFPRQASLRVVRAGAVAGGAAVLLCLLTPPRIFGQTGPLLPWVGALVSAWLLWVLLRACRARERGAPILLLGVLAMLGAATHDVVRYTHLASGSLLPYGVVAVVLTPAILLAQRLARALAIEELRSQEQRGRADLLMRATQAGVLDWNAATGQVQYSERYLEMLGLDGRDPATLPPFRSLVHPEDEPRVHASFLRQLRDRRVRSGLRRGEGMDYRMLRADGEVLWVHAEAMSVCGADGRTLRYVCTFIDISHLKRTELKLATEQRRLELVVRGAQVGIVDWDGHSHETWYSPRFREIRGYPPDADTSGWPDYFQVMIHPDDRARVTKRWVAFIKGRGPEGPRGEWYSPEEYRLLRADGSHAWVQVSGVAVRDAQGFVTRWIAAILDVSERRAEQEALRASRDQVAAQAGQLERQNEALKENVRLREEVERIGRHDLKTPLNSIVAVPRLLREERKLGPEADELLGVVERAGYRILSMVNLSLDLYRMEQGSYIFRPDAVDLVDLARKVMADVRMHAASKQVRLLLQAGHPPFAWAEELLCYSLLANLLKNAVEASPEGEAVTLAVEADDGGGVRLRIHNRGAVPEAIRASFFRKYTTLGKASGTGLGTYSAWLMARVQDGEIRMETSDADGTTLTVRLRAAPAGKVPAALRHAAERADREPPALAALPALRVLLVDDDEYNLLIVRRFLPSPPFTVDTAINGRVALAAAQLQWPDLVFMDLDMPVMGGFEAVGRLRALQGGRNCSMVALSSHEDEATRQRALQAGFDRYLAKPVTREMIHAVLLELHGGGTAVAAPPSAPPGPTPPPRADDVVRVDPDAAPILQEFLGSRRRLLDELEAAAGQDRREEVRRLAHLLAGSFALYGFGWASERSRWLEAQSPGLEPAALQAWGRELREHLDTVEIRFETA